jgi:hypothetical protein
MMLLIAMHFPSTRTVLQQQAHLDSPFSTACAAAAISSMMASRAATFVVIAIFDGLQADGGYQWIVRTSQVHRCCCCLALEGWNHFIAVNECQRGPVQWVLLSHELICTGRCRHWR